MKRVAGYGRVSTSAQVLEGTSAKEQKRRIIKECQNRGWSLYKFFSDDGISGKRIEKRHGLQQLLKDAERKKFDVLMFTNIDRLARNVRELLNIAHIIQDKYQLDFLSIDVPWIDTSTPLGKLMLQIFGVFAEFEQSQIKGRTVSGKMIKWKNMEAPIGQPPFGYKFNKSKKRYEFDSDNPEKIETVKKIYDLYDYQHYSMNDIAIKLSEDNIPTPSSYRWKKKAASHWNIHTVRRILIETAYKGKAIHNRYKHKESKYEKHYTFQSKEEKPKNEWIAIEFQPLISEGRWNKIQARIEQQKNKPKKRHRGFEERFLAENVIKCGECNSKMNKDLHIRPRKDGTAKLNYMCHWQNASRKVLKSANRRKCILRRVDADHVDGIIFKHVAQVLSSPLRFAEEWMKNENVHEIKSKLERLQRKIKDKKKEIKRATSIIVKAQDSDVRKIAEAEFEKSETGLIKMKEKLKSINSEYECIRYNVDILAEFQEAVKNGYGYGIKKVADPYVTELMQFLYNLPFKEKKRIVEAVIAAEKGGSCKIRYRRPTDYLNHGDLLTLKKEDWEQDTPLLDKEPRIDMEFWVDLKSIAALIDGLNKDKLFNKIGRWGTSSGKIDCFESSGTLQTNPDLS